MLRDCENFVKVCFQLLFSLLSPDWIVDSVRVFAATQRPPLRHVEPLPPHEVVLDIVDIIDIVTARYLDIYLADLLWSPEHEPEVLAPAANQR